MLIPPDLITFKKFFFLDFVIQIESEVKTNCFNKDVLTNTVGYLNFSKGGARMPGLL